MAESSVVAISDRALSVELTSPLEARSLGEFVRRDEIWQDVVPGLNSLSVLFDPVHLPLAAARERFTRLLLEAPVAAETSSPSTLVVGVSYGGDEGPDLSLVAAGLGMPEEEVIRLHTSAEYDVELMGFLPGFAYLSGLDPRLTAARRSSPRLRVEAGSVAIGGDRAGIYSLEGSGGWHVIGRTRSPLFNKNADDPFALKPGMTIRFEAL